MKENKALIIFSVIVNIVANITVLLDWKTDWFSVGLGHFRLKQTVVETVLVISGCFFYGVRQLLRRFC